ncbi:hypothetical protein [Nevskia ramosa]|uniref:hypothetical protein n=1 Tax=Nevskia ramosa TaxID=64002 RepID=UPI002355E2C4|nr:hypothetical protein [Nevskia ramosa]
MLKQVAIEFRLPRYPEPRFSGSSARHLVSLIAGNEVHPRLFHHGDDRVSTLKSPSLIRWSGGRQSFRINGIGPLGIEDVVDAMPIIANALMARHGEVGIRRIESECSLVHSAEPSFYIASNLVLARDARAFQKVALDMTDADRIALAERIVSRSIRRQYDYLVETYGDAFGDELNDFDWKHFSIKPLAVGPLVPRRTSHGGVVYTVADFAFQAHFNIKGAWGAGHAVNPGLGQIWFAQLPSVCENWRDYLHNSRGDRPSEESVRDRAQVARTAFAGKRPVRSAA